VGDEVEVVGVEAWRGRGEEGEGFKQWD